LLLQGSLESKLIGKSNRAVIVRKEPQATEEAIPVTMKVTGGELKVEDRT